MNSETIKAQLKELRMHTAASELEPTLAAQQQTIQLDWVSALLAHEIDARKERAVACA